MLGPEDSTNKFLKLSSQRIAQMLGPEDSTNKFIKLSSHKQLFRMSHVFCIVYQSKRLFMPHIFLPLNCPELPQSFVHVSSLKRHIIALTLFTALLYNLCYLVPGLLAGGGALWACCSRLPLSSRGWVPCNVAETARECSVTMFASRCPTVSPTPSPTVSYL